MHHYWSRAWTLLLLWLFKVLLRDVLCLLAVCLVAPPRLTLCNALISGAMSDTLGGFVLSPTVLFDHPTLRKLSLFIENSLFPHDAHSSASTVPMASVRPQDTECAVVAMSCRFPGGCEGTDAFWEFLMGGGDAIMDVPGRWDPDAYVDSDLDAPNKAYVMRGGFVVGIEGFDSQFFCISRTEVTTSHHHLNSD